MLKKHLFGILTTGHSQNTECKYKTINANTSSGYKCWKIIWPACSQRQCWCQRQPPLYHRAEEVREQGRSCLPMWKHHVFKPYFIIWPELLTPVVSSPSMNMLKCNALSYTSLHWTWTTLHFIQLHLWSLLQDFYAHHSHSTNLFQYQVYVMMKCTASQYCYSSKLNKLQKKKLRKKLFAKMLRRWLVWLQIDSVGWYHWMWMFNICYNSNIEKCLRANSLKTQNPSHHFVNLMLSILYNWSGSSFHAGFLLFILHAHLPQVNKGNPTRWVKQTTMIVSVLKLFIRVWQNLLKCRCLTRMLISTPNGKP